MPYSYISVEVNVPVLSKHTVLSMPAYNVLDTNILLIPLSFSLAIATAKTKLNKLPKNGGIDCASSTTTN